MGIGRKQNTNLARSDEWKKQTLVATAAHVCHLFHLFSIIVTPASTARRIIQRKRYETAGKDSLVIAFLQLTLPAFIARVLPTTTVYAIAYHLPARASSRPSRRPLSTGVSNSMSKKLRYVDVGQRPLLKPSFLDHHRLHHGRSVSTSVTPSLEAFTTAREPMMMISKTCYNGRSMLDVESSW